jgi:hypothetical protein
VRVTVGRGFRKGPAILREEGSFVVLDRRFGPSRLAPDAPPEFEGGEENLHLRRFEGTVQLWRPRYVTKKGIDRLDGIEDIDLGSSARATVGWAPRVLGGTEEEGYAGADLVRGATMGARSFGLIRGSVSTRLKQEPLETQLRAEARLVDQTLPRQTVVFAATTTAGIRAPRDFQVILGGLSGLRAYPIEALSGESGLRLNFEDRVVLAREILQVVSLGLVAFYDAGRVWGVGSQGRAWIQDAGTGLRISLSRSSHKRVLRADVAWPISPTRDGRGGPVISFGSEQAF